MIWSNLITGAVIFFFGLIAVYYGMRARTRETH
jgi:hypothetical protein